MAVVTPLLVSRRIQRRFSIARMPRHIQVLPRSAGVSIPAIIGDIHEDLRAVARELPNLISKDRLVADEDAVLVRHLR